jgi:ATP-binding protein involved in chromosome partitioning
MPLGCYAYNGVSLARRDPHLGAHGHQHGGQGMPAPQPLPGIQYVIAVGSGKGGVGKTTVSVNLAIALAKTGHRVGLLDGDVYGPNVPMMMGALSEQPRMVEEDRIAPIEKDGVKMISVGVLNPGDKPVIWRGPMLHSIIRQFLQQVDWGELDYLIIDLPPGTGDVALSLIQTVPVNGAIVVSTPSGVALQDARKAIEMFKQLRVEILGIVENMGYFVCPHCSKEVDVFSKGGGSATAQQYGLPLIGEIPLDPAVREGGDEGKPVALDGAASPHAAALYRLADRVMERVKELGANDPVIQIK